MRRARLLLLTMLLATLLTTGNQPATAQQGSVTFEQTGKTVSGRFLSHWQQQGGLAQFGYPISDVLTDTSPLDGQAYQMQYFERAVFELHPQNQQPYDVLLTQLGTLLYQARYPQGAASQQPSRDNPRYFAETGHSVGGSFRAYWEQHGGLAVQGLPLSDEFEETSMADGQRYRVQYFERSVFEYHPDNQPDYFVLLSQLGRYRYAEELKPRLVASGRIAEVADAGGSLFWTTVESGRQQPLPDTILHTYDARTRQAAVVAADKKYRYGLGGNSRNLFWSEAVLVGDRDNRSIRRFEVATDSTTTMPGSDMESLTLVGVDERSVYYTTERRTGSRYDKSVYSRSLASGEEQRVDITPSVEPNQSFSVSRVEASDGALAWSEQYVNATLGIGESRLHLRKADGSDVLLATRQRQYISNFAVAGDYVIWLPGCYCAFGGPPEDASYPVYLHQISTGQTRVLSSKNAGWVELHDGLAAWSETDESSGKTSIITLELATNQRSVVLEASNIGMRAMIGRNYIAYTRFTGELSDEYYPSGELYTIRLR